jgi:hypothetical protein
VGGLQPSADRLVVAGPWERNPTEAGDTHVRSAQSTHSWSTKTLPQPTVELEVEQPAAGRREDVGSPADVDAGSTAATKGGHMAGLKAECRPGGTWAERPR